MPIYEYVCQSCGEEIEVIQKVSDPPLKKHAGCGGRLKKKLSLAAFHLKGGGWYADGYSQTPQQDEKPAKKTVDTKSKPTSTPKNAEPKKPKNEA